MTDSSKTCRECRHHSKQTNTKLVAEVYDTIAELDDEVHFICMKQAAKAIGPVPLADCPLFELPPKRSKSDIELLLERRVAEALASDEES